MIWPTVRQTAVSVSDDQAGDGITRGQQYLMTAFMCDFGMPQPSSDPDEALSVQVRAERQQSAAAGQRDPPLQGVQFSREVICLSLPKARHFGIAKLRHGERTTISVTLRHLAVLAEPANPCCHTQKL